MGIYLQMAWRNVWRNRRRTLVILTAVVIGVWSMICVGALSRGIADQMVQNGIATLTGHLQIHRRGFRSDPVVENSMTDPAAVLARLPALLPPGSRWSVRVRVNAVAANARHSGGVTLVGVDPAREAQVSFIGGGVTTGVFLPPDVPWAIVVGRALAEQFDTRPGRKLVLMSQDTEREIASRAFRITGVFDAEMAATEKQFVFVNLAQAREMLKLGGGASEVAIVLPDPRLVDTVAHRLRTALASERCEVHTWQELLPLVTAILKMYDVFIFLWFLVVFVAMSFGIVNTTLMAVFERIREFGLLRALGMKPSGIVASVLTESLMLLALGSGLGNALGLASVLALSERGIDLSAMAAGLEFAGMGRVIIPRIVTLDLALANGVVLVLGAVVSVYPALKAARVTPVEALSHT
ncbi:MAG: ABC transporter permease [Desulfobacteraceae bacterium]|nr:ABC transporter permease [Desulfobacteraceae bacterium]